MAMGGWCVCVKCEYVAERADGAGGTRSCRSWTQTEARVLDADGLTSDGLRPATPTEAERR
jgi:hypothetical protein